MASTFKADIGTKAAAPQVVQAPKVSSSLDSRSGTSPAMIPTISLAGYQPNYMQVLYDLGVLGR